MKLHAATLSCPLLLALAAGCADTDVASGDNDAGEAAASLTIDAAFEATVATGRNTLRVEVTDSAGAPVPAAVVSVEAMMPTMGHGSTEAPVVSALGDGQYAAFPVTFQMRGRWKVVVEATQGDAAGRVELTVSVP